jgi:hypothetical protein
MAFYNLEVKQYDVYYPADGKNASGYPYRATIGLRKDDGTLHGALYFHRNPSTMPDYDTRTINPPYISANYPENHFPVLLDILRNEKPVYLRWVGSETQGQAAITTSLEPVGENERA